MKNIISFLFLMFLLAGCSQDMSKVLEAKKEFENRCIEGNNTLSLTFTMGTWGTAVSSTCIYNGGK